MFTFTQDECNEKLDSALEEFDECVNREINLPNGDINRCENRFLRQNIESNLTNKYEKSAMCAQNPTVDVAPCSENYGGPMVYQDFNLESPRFVLGATLHGTFTECSNNLPATLVK